MADLVAILEARGTDYARAQTQLDTSGEAVEQSFAKLQRIAADMLGPHSKSAAPRVPAEGAQP
jgi:lambda repressor-like predicted transcriptional regulator